MKNKLLLMFMALILLFALTACGNDAADDETNAPEPTTTATATKVPTKAPTVAPTNTPTPTPAPKKTVYDISGWKIYVGFVEAQGDFYGDTIVFVRDKSFYQGGIMILKDGAENRSGGYIFGRVSVDESTDMYKITDEATGEVAPFGLIGMSGGYSLELGNLGYIATMQFDENTGKQFYDIIINANTDISSEFLAAITEVEEGALADGYFTGVMSTGETVHYARTGKGLNNGLVITSVDRYSVVMAQGETSYDEATQTETITDIFTGDKVFYKVEAVEGGYKLSFGKNGKVGTVTLAKCTQYDFEGAMDYAFKDPKNVTEDFIKKLNK